MPSPAPLASIPFCLVLLVAACCCLLVDAGADNASHAIRRRDPEVTPYAKPEEGTPACSACGIAPHSSACLTAYHRQPAVYCGNSTVKLAHVHVSAAACCPLVLDATPVQCVPIEYNMTAGGGLLVDSFTCRGKVLLPPPGEDQRLLQTAMGLLGVVAPICLIMAVYALCRLYRRSRASSILPTSDDDTDATKDGSEQSAIPDVAVRSYEIPEFRPIISRTVELNALGRLASSDDENRRY